MPREKPISTKRSLSARLKMSVQYRIYIAKRFITRLNTWLLNKTADHIYYKHLSEKELLASRKSDTVFIFGSSYSLNTISEKEWKFFEKSKPARSCIQVAALPKGAKIEIDAVAFIS